MVRAIFQCVLPCCEASQTPALPTCIAYLLAIVLDCNAFYCMPTPLCYSLYRILCQELSCKHIGLQRIHCIVYTFPGTFLDCTGFYCTHTLCHSPLDYFVYYALHTLPGSFLQLYWIAAHSIARGFWDAQPPVLPPSTPVSSDDWLTTVVSAAELSIQLVSSTELSIQL